MAFPLSVPDKLGRSDIGDHGQAIIQDPGCVVITRSGRAEKAQQIRLVVWHQTKSENRPAAGKIDLRKMKTNLRVTPPNWAMEGLIVSSMFRKLPAHLGSCSG